MTKGRIPMSKIIGEQHDFNQIVTADLGEAIRMVETRLLGAAGVWDVSEMGISREQAVRQYNIAATDAQRDAVLVDLRDRAVRRANLAKIDGRITFAGVGSGHWHGLGTSVEEAMTSAEAIKLASLGYEVRKLPVKAVVDTHVNEAGEPEDSLMHVPKVFAVGRVTDDSIRVFDGVSIGEKHTLIQNSQAFEFIDEVLIDYGARYDSAGAIGSGEKIWLSAVMPKEIEPVRGDVIQNYVVLTNAHDGTEALNVFATDYRIVCANTRRQALRAAGARRGQLKTGAKGISIRHTGRVKAKIELAKVALGLIRESFNQYADLCNSLTKFKIKPEVFINRVLDRHLEVGCVASHDAAKGIEQLIKEANITDAEAMIVLEAKLRRLMTRRDKAFTEVMTIYESGTNTASGTLWGAFQAMTQHANHSLNYRGDSGKQAGTRFDSLLTGRADDYNQTAYDVVLDLVTGA